MDLKKLDPMARKMRSHVDAFYKALEQQDGVSARSHITEVMKSMLFSLTLIKSKMENNLFYLRLLMNLHICTNPKLAPILIHGLKKARLN